MDKKLRETTTSSPGRFSLALGAGREKDRPADARAFSRPAPKAREKRPGDEVGETTNLCEEIMNSKRQVKGKLGHAVQIRVCRSNVMLNLSIIQTSNS